MAPVIWFLVLITLSLAALIVAWAKGRQWGDLSSRRGFGEVLTDEEQQALARSRLHFWIWAGASLVLAALSFLALR